MYDCPDRNGLDGIQSVTRIGHFLKSSKPSHGLDVQSVTWIGCSIRDSRVSRIECPFHDWDWMVWKSVQSQSQFGCLIRDLEWTSSTTPITNVILYCPSFYGHWLVGWWDHTTLDAWQLTFSPTGSVLRLGLFFIIVSGLGLSLIHIWRCRRRG